ncbi:MAG: hypothetical protein KGL39_04730 [Patescibacteria group bacterium]|nr:hypothetical protein [Patescibacteria group bacterium]
MTRSAHQNATYPQKIACLILIAFESGHPFVCPICGEPILPGQTIQFDHGAAVGRGGTNEVRDIRPVHYDQPPFDCHQRKTWGGSAKATTLGTDTHEAAKLKRILGETCTRPKKKIQSRGFGKTRRPMTRSRHDNTKHLDRIDND